MGFGVGIHDGAYKGRLHSHVLFVGRTTSTMWEKTYDNMLGQSCTSMAFALALYCHNLVILEHQ